MFDSFTDDQASDMGEQIYEEGRNADEDKLADEVYNYYNHLRDDKGFSRNEAIECIANDLKVSNPERYL